MCEPRFGRAHTVRSHFLQSLLYMRQRGSAVWSLPSHVSRGNHMTLRAHDQVMLGTFVIVVLSVIGGAVTVVGFPGSVAEITISEVLKDTNGALHRAFPSLETLAKLAGIAIT